MKKKIKRDMNFLRTAVELLDTVNEGFNDRYNVTELLAIVESWMTSEWDIPPDEWTTRQVKEAIKGKPPMFREPKGSERGYVAVHQ